MKVQIPAKTAIESIIAPPSKSYAQRAILAATLGYEPITLQNIGTSDDVNNILEIAAQLGAAITVLGNSVTIQGNQASLAYHLNVGESGLGIRLVTSIVTALDGDFTLNGEGSLLKRPMNEFHSLLPQMGVECISKDGFLPLKIKGKARGGNIVIDGGISSQYLSGLLMALPLLEEDSLVTVNNLKSKPYVDITIDLLKAFGVYVSTTDYASFKIKGNQNYHRLQDYSIEGDYSGASNWMVYGAINEGIRIYGLKPNSDQADRMMLEALTLANVSYEWEEGALYVMKSTPSAFSFDASECPDLFPALVVLAAACQGTTWLSGANRLLFKESSRGVVLQTEFAKLGLEITLNGDLMSVHGTGKLNSGTIASNNDHRIAMAGAIASGLTPKGVTITDAECVAKSYPEFWETMGMTT